MVLLPAFNGFWVIVMRTFYKTAIPFEPVESAKIDGAGEFRIFFRIVYPLAVPGLATIALMQALAYWNDFFTLLLYLLGTRQQELQNLQYMMYSALMNTIMLMRIAQISNQTGVLSAIPAETYRLALAVVAIGPLVLVYPFVQRFFIKGLTIGAVKG